MTKEANQEVGAAAARISRLEGMEGHARAGDSRLYKYFPDEEFDLGR
jgi:sulfopropanediol 3-dehydrogenase